MLRQDWKGGADMNMGDPRQKKHSESDFYQKAYESGYNFVNGMGFWSVDPKEAQRRRIMATSGHLALCMLLYVFLRGYAATPSLQIIQRYFRAELPQNAQMFYQFTVMVSDILCLMVPCLLYLALDHIPKRAVFPHRHVAPYKIVCSVSMVLSVSVVVMLCSQLSSILISWFHIVPIGIQEVIPSNPGAMAVYVIHNTIILAFFEELAFHGAVMQSLRRYSDVFALVASSMVYALMHLNPARIFSSFILSLCTGFFVLYTGSLWTGIFSHCALGILVIIQTIITDYLAMDLCTIIFCLFTCVVLIAGLISFMRLCKTDDNLFSFQNRGEYLKNSQRFGAFLSTPGMVIALIVLIFLCVQFVQVI